MKIRKAILTGGGRGTRLHPITTTINKHLLPLANKPMIFHAIEKLVHAGITDIFINVNPGETELQKHIGDGGHWSVNISYFEQTGGPQGIAHVVSEAERYIGRDPFIFYLSDNVILGDVREMVDEFVSGNYDCMLALSKVPDPERFGVPVFDDHGVLTDVIEKPSNPTNNFAVTGIYVYGAKVFYKAYENIEKSARGEYEISSIHSYFLKNGYSVGHKEITGWWKDTGKPNDLLKANELLLDHSNPDVFINQGVVEASTKITGSVRVGGGTRIGKNVSIQGPVIIGENCILENCSLGPHVTIGSGSEIYKASIRNSIVLENVYIDCDLDIFESLVGKHAKIIKKERPITGHKLIVGDKTILEL